MPDGKEVDPDDTCNVTAAGRTADGRGVGNGDKNGQDGELEPRDSRNVTGTAVTEDGRWTGAAVKPEEGPKVPEALGENATHPGS